jgi:hypothetical protein
MRHEHRTGLGATQNIPAAFFLKPILSVIADRN